MAAGCAAVAVYAGVLARADWLRTHPSEAYIEEAIRIDRMNPYAYTVRAEYLEQAGKFTDAERAWREALHWNGRDAEAWMRVALLRERAGDGAGAERCLLRAAEVSRTWLPRWALVNFYFRQGRKQEAYRWARLALQRASDDVEGLFAVLEREGAPPEFVLRELLPRNRAVMAAFLRRHLQDGVAVEEAASKLAGMIPDVAPGWPGASEGLEEGKCDDGERGILLAAVDRMLDDGRGPAAVRLWDVLRSRGVVGGEGWAERHPVLNARFERAPYGAGLDWRVSQVAGVDIAARRGELRVELSGKQPESVDLVSQRVVLPPGREYRVEVEAEFEGLKEGCGLEWELRDGALLVLRYRRPVGQMRAEGVARFRRVGLGI